MNAHSTVYVDETRYNLYASIHKGLRRSQTLLLVRLGSLDAADTEAVAQVIADMRFLITLGRKHLAHENLYIHGAIEARRAGATERLAEDHDHHERDFDELEQMLGTLEAELPSRRSPIVRAIYLRYSQFVAEDFTHMIEEETETLSLLHRLFTDAELQTIEERIIGSVEPDLMLEFLRMMVPAMNQRERLGMLSGMKAAMPAPVFAAVIHAGVKPTLPASDFLWLEYALSMAA